MLISNLNYASFLRTRLRLPEGKFKGVNPWDRVYIQGVPEKKKTQVFGYITQ